MSNLLLPQYIHDFLAEKPLIRDEIDSHWPATFTLAHFLKEMGEEISLFQRFYSFSISETSEFFLTEKKSLGNLIYFKWQDKAWWCFGEGNDQTFLDYISTRLHVPQSDLIFEKFDEIEYKNKYHIREYDYLRQWEQECQAYCEKQRLNEVIPNTNHSDASKYRL